ncbi:drug:proton antiporter, partial [Raoultella ornithinolytica]
PVTLEFGHTFVGADPDGHRLRVYSRAEGLVARD